MIVVMISGSTPATAEGYRYDKIGVGNMTEIKSAPVLVTRSRSKRIKRGKVVLNFGLNSMGYTGKGGGHFKG